VSDRPLEVRIAVAENRLDNIEEEQLRHRMRLHDLEADRATLRLIVGQLEKLATEVPKVAKQAALEAIDLAMDHRDELGNRRWTLRVQWLALGVTFGGLVATVVLLVTGG
jgi:hypothetical protein